MNPSQFMEKNIIIFLKPHFTNTVYDWYYEKHNLGNNNIIKINSAFTKVLQNTKNWNNVKLDEHRVECQQHCSYQMIQSFILFTMKKTFDITVSLDDIAFDYNKLIHHAFCLISELLFNKVELFNDLSNYLIIDSIINQSLVIVLNKLIPYQLIIDHHLDNLIVTTPVINNYHHEIEQLNQLLRNLVPTIVQPVGPHVVQPVGPHVVQPVGPHVVQPVGPHVVQPVGPHVVQPVGQPIVQPIVQPVGQVIIRQGGGDSTSPDPYPKKHSYDISFMAQKVQEKIQNNRKKHNNNQQVNNETLNQPGNIFKSYHRTKEEYCG